MSRSRNPFRSLRWKRNRKLVAGILACLVVLLVGFGSMRVTAITWSERHSLADDVRLDVQGLQDIFDDNVIHDVSVTFDRAAYNRMIETYKADGTKEFIEASITIDGTTINSVGLRLKGNSTLRGASNASPAEDEDGQSIPDQTGRSGIGGNLSLDDPTGLPWLISFDAFVDGQRYQGYEEIAVRAMTGREAMLHEALALTLVGMAGEPTQRASYSSFSVNDEAGRLRLLVEVPRASFAAEHFDSNGVLYKARSTGKFEYLGEDPLAYVDAFEQITRRNQQDLAPLINTLKWVEEASDEEFAANLADHVNVESLARYVALQKLLKNFDDMSGPGQNYYLWYDFETETFRILNWDLNLAFAQGGFGGMQPDIAQRPDNTDAESRQQPPAEEQPANSRRMSGNLLKERFLTTSAFHAIYARAYAEVYTALYANGQALTELERFQTLLSTTNLITDTTLASEAEALRMTIELLIAAGPEVNGIPR